MFTSRRSWQAHIKVFIQFSVPVHCSCSSHIQAQHAACCMPEACSRFTRKTHYLHFRAHKAASKCGLVAVLSSQAATGSRAQALIQVQACCYFIVDITASPASSSGQRRASSTTGVAIAQNLTFNSLAFLSKGFIRAAQTTPPDKGSKLVTLTVLAADLAS